MERTVNDIILENGYSLPKETGMFAQKHSSVGSNYRKTFERLWGKENTDRLTDDLLGKLILIRNHLIDTNIPLKGDFVYVVDGQAKAYRNGLEIGYLNNSYIDNGKALHPEMVKKQGTNNAGVSELLYNGTILAENRPIISGSRLLMPEVTTHIWSKYPTRKLISTEGVHAWPLRTAQERGIKLNYEKNWHTLPEFSKLHQLALDENIRTDLTGLPIYELSEPSYLPMVKNARVFDISLLRDGYINLDFTPGFAYKQGGKINAIKQFKQGGQVRKMLTASGGPIYWLRKKLYNNIEPFGYNDVGSRLYNGIILNKNEHNNFKGDYSDPEKAPALYLTIDNIWGEYLHIPEKERRYSNGKYKIKNNGNGTFSLPFESMEDIMQVVNSSNNPLLWGLRGKLGNSVVGEYDVHRGYDKNGDYLKYIDHWRINPYDVKENKEYGLDDNSILKWYFKGKDDASFGLGTPVEIQGKYYLDDIYNVKGKDRGGHYLPEIIVTGKKKQGGKMNVLEFLKNGSGIHIKEKNKGKFTSYCGGKVTDECILKGKNSSNPAIRKRATFAANARKWKHKEGGIIKAADGTKTNFGLKVSNALGKVGNFLNSDLGSNLVNIGTSVVGGIAQNNVINKQIEANNEDREVNKQEAVLKRYLELKAEKRKKNKSYFDNNGNIINESPITSDSEAWNEALKTTDTSGIDDYYNKSNIALSYAKNSNNWDMLGSIGGLSSSILNSFGNKKDSNSSNNNYFGNYVKTLYKNQGTFNSDGSMNLGHGLGTFSTTGGYKPQQYQMKTYTPLLKFSL